MCDERKMHKMHQKQRSRPPQARLPSEPRKRKRSPPSSVLHPQAYLDFFRK